MQASGGGLKSAVSGTQYSSSRQQQLACVLCVLCVLLLCFTYVREPDHKAGVSLFYKSPSWEFSLVWFCVGVYLGYLESAA